jgi:hypothetical protein
MSNKPSLQHPPLEICPGCNKPWYRCLCKWAPVQGDWFLLKSLSQVVNEGRVKLPSSDANGHKPEADLETLTRVNWCDTVFLEKGSVRL